MDRSLVSHVCHVCFDTFTIDYCLRCRLRTCGTPSCAHYTRRWYWASCTHCAEETDHGP